MDGRAQFAALLAEAWRYPHPGLREHLLQHLLPAPEPGVQPGAVPYANGAAEQQTMPGQKDFIRFLKRIAELSPAGWEELYTRTWDLNPIAAPYIGYQLYGDSYKRGNFMSNLNRHLQQTGIDTGGELPDHILSVLRFLAATSVPPKALIEALGPALDKIQAALRKEDPKNPYLHLLEATKRLEALYRSHT